MYVLPGEEQWICHGRDTYGMLFFFFLFLFLMVMVEWVEIDDTYRRMFCLWDVAVKGKVGQAESSVNDSVIHVLDSLFDGIHVVNNVLVLAGNISLADCCRT